MGVGGSTDGGTMEEAAAHVAAHGAGTSPSSAPAGPATAHELAWPERRPLKIFARDPLSGWTAGNVAVVDVPYEALQPGPSGSRITVIDYDGANHCFYEPVDLDSGPILIRNGLDPSESDPRFHQQMVYAVTARVLENFERALGRTINFSRGRLLTVLPHAFRGANAFFEPKTNSVLFGYFDADPARSGTNLPGQTIFTCLSHDIVAHEVTHGILYRLRPHFSTPTNRDCLAFHEGFADIVAIFQHFTFPDILQGAIQAGHADISKVHDFLDLARQFGQGTGHSEALRSALEADGPKVSDYSTYVEPHERGSLLVAAIFDTFFKTYQARIADLVRVATGGSGLLPGGDLHPDLVKLLAAEASKAAQSILGMAIRAIEFLPPVDVTFGDYLRALVTADHELYPQDQLGQRAFLIEAFRSRGIYPQGVRSLADASLIWPPGDGRLPIIDQDVIGTLMQRTIMQASGKGGGSSTAGLLDGYAKDNAAALQLDPSRPGDIRVEGFHPIMRIGSDGRVKVHMVCQFTQRWVAPDTSQQLGGLALAAGTTVVFSQDGRVKYLIPKPLTRAATAADGPGAPNVDAIAAYVADLDAHDDTSMWRDPAYEAQRMVHRASFWLLDQRPGRDDAALGNTTPGPPG